MNQAPLASCVQSVAAIMSGMASKHTDAAIAANIRKAIAESGRNKSWIAAQLDVSPQAITGWERYGSISLEKAVELAQLLGITIDGLLRGGASAPSRGLDPQRLSIATNFLRDQFKLWGFQWDAAERSPIIAKMYRDLTPENVIEMTHWLAEQLQEGRGVERGSETSGASRIDSRGDAKRKT